MDFLIYLVGHAAAAEPSPKLAMLASSCGYIDYFEDIIFESNILPQLPHRFSSIQIRPKLHRAIGVDCAKLSVELESSLNVVYFKQAYL